MRIYTVRKLFNQYNRGLREKRIASFQIYLYKDHRSLYTGIYNRDRFLYFNGNEERRYIAKTLLNFHSGIQKINPLMRDRIIVVTNTITNDTVRLCSDEDEFRSLYSVKFYYIPYGKVYKMRIRNTTCSCV